MFDAKGNLWSGQNWMAGSQSGAINNIGGGVVKLAPNGTPLSPPITGFTGMGLDGDGWGTAVTLDKVWASSFNGKILVLDFDGRPIGSESDFPFKEKLFGLMGIGVAANGDVWIAEGPNNQLLFFPGGRIKDGRIVNVAGLKSPFDIVIDFKLRLGCQLLVGHGCPVPSQRSLQGGELPGRDRRPRPCLGFEGKCLGGEQHGFAHTATEVSRRHIHHGAVQAHCAPYD